MVEQKLKKWLKCRQNGKHNILPRTADHCEWTRCFLQLSAAAHVTGDKITPTLWTSILYWLWCEKICCSRNVGLIWMPTKPWRTSLQLIDKYCIAIFVLRTPHNYLSLRNATSRPPIASMRTQTATNETKLNDPTLSNAKGSQNDS